MALTECPDCGKQVSDMAPSCPECGRPMAGADKPGPGPDAGVTTVQETSRRLKGHQLAGSAVLITGFVTLAQGAHNLGALLLFAGAFWVFGAALASWWRHG